MAKKFFAIFAIAIILIAFSGCLDQITSPVKLENGKEQTAGQAAQTGAEKVNEDTEKLKELVGDI